MIDSNIVRVQVEYREVLKSCLRNLKEGQTKAQIMKIEIPDDLYKQFEEHARLNIGMDTVEEAVEHILVNEIRKFNGSISLDTCTGVRSRDQLEADINRQTWPAKVNEHPVYANNFLCIDIDNLKGYMDINGLTAGDILLQEIADELVDNYGDENVYRFGADEFVVRLGDRKFAPSSKHAEMIKHSVVQVSARMNQRRNHYINRVIVFHLDRGIIESSREGKELTCEVGET